MYWAILTATRSADFLTESRARWAWRGRLGLAVAEQPADDRQALAERERPRGETVTEVCFGSQWSDHLVEGLRRSRHWRAAANASALLDLCKKSQQPSRHLLDPCLSG